jgi:hypothetical protein
LLFLELFTNLPVGTLRNSGFGSIAVAMLHPGKDNGCLFYNEIILYVFDPFDTACDLARLIDSCLRINEAAQLNDAFAGFYPDLK